MYTETRTVANRTFEIRAYESSATEIDVYLDGVRIVSYLDDHTTATGDLETVTAALTVLGQYLDDLDD